MIAKKFNLYGSEGCHLCEQALALCLSVMSEQDIAQIDIVDQTHVPHENLSLAQLYGVHIPVLERLSDNEKLFWPFDAEQIMALVQP